MEERRERDLTLISTQGMALAATECRREGVGVGGAGWEWVYKSDTPPS